MKKWKIAPLKSESSKQACGVEEGDFTELVFRRRRLASFTFLSVVLFSFIGLQLKMNYDKDLKATMVRKVVVKKQKELKKQKQKLQKQVRLLEDEDFVAKLARSKYYYSKRGEQVYILPENVQDVNRKIINFGKK